MIQTIDELAQGAIQLPPDQRFTLAQRILASVEPPGDSEIDKAWAAEILDRMRRFDSGETKGIPAVDVFAKMDQRLAR
ncbi:MAG: addiction module protein [Luteolibacter sp.]|uniref:addiction module protein n=1 Tax=Luteolibacter sp. TaxID=1962973 RepID=UPI0032662F21